MTYKIRVIKRKQDLKRPDEFLTTYERLTDWFDRHIHRALIFLGVVILVAVSLGIWIWYGMQREEIASELVAEATMAYHEATMGGLAQENIETEGGDALGRAIEAYERILTEYPETRAALLGQFYLGNAFLDSGDYEKAVQAYREFLNRNEQSPILDGLAQQRLGYALIRLDRMAEAEKELGKALEIEVAHNKDQVLYELGRLQELEGKSDQAIQNYKRIMADYPDSVLASEARVRLRGLGVEEEEPSSLHPENVTPEGGTLPGVP